MPAMRKPMPQPQSSPEGPYHTCRDASVPHCAQYILVQTDPIAARLVQFPESSGECIFLPSGYASSDLDPQDRFRSGENFEHGEQFQLATLRIEKLLNFSSRKTDKSRRVRPKRLRRNLGARIDAAENGCAGFADQCYLKLKPRPNEIDIRIVMTLE
jgi:hypothetical protein